MISIIIPLYNKQNCIKETIQSVLSQSFTDFELIIVNDGSTDNSLEIIRTFTDKRINVISQSNGGVSSARNRGIKESKGEYLLLIDADDYLMPNALEIFHELMVYYPNKDVYIGSFIERDNLGNICKESKCKINGIIPNPIKSLWERKIYSRMGNTLIRREKIIQEGFFRTDITLYEDLDFITNIEVNCTMASSDKLILEYRRGTEGLSTKKVPIKKEFAGTIRLKNLTGYKKKIVAEHLCRRFLKHMFRLNFYDTYVILKNNGLVELIYSFIMFIVRKK